MELLNLSGFIKHIFWNQSNFRRRTNILVGRKIRLLFLLLNVQKELHGSSDTVNLSIFFCSSFNDSRWNLCSDSFDLLLNRSLSLFRNMLNNWLIYSLQLISSFSHWIQEFSLLSLQNRVHFWWCRLCLLSDLSSKPITLREVCPKHQSKFPYWRKDVGVRDV